MAITLEITMALTGYERQKRWREKNRAIYNLRRRNARKNSPSGSGVGAAKADDPAATLFTTKKVGELNMVVMPPRTTEDAPQKPIIFRDDWGRVISEGQWKRLQRLKEKAKNGGYELDEHSQL